MQEVEQCREQLPRVGERVARHIVTAIRVSIIYVKLNTVDVAKVMDFADAGERRLW